MKSNIRKRALFLLLCLSLFTTASVTRANAVSFYAATLHGVNGHAPSFVFSDGTFAETTFIGNIDSAEPMAVMPCGANCNGTYYGLLAKEGVPYKLVTVDWPAGQTTDVVSLSSDYPAFFDMAYSYATEKLYAALNGEEGTTAIYEIDKTDGTYAKVADLGVKARAIDFSFDGTLYVLNTVPYNSDYGEVNALVLTSYDSSFTLKEAKQVFSEWDPYVGIYDNGTYNTISMEFDHAKKILYYTQTDSRQQYAYAIDVKEGNRLSESVILGSDPSNTQNFDAVSLYIPFIAPDGGANSAIEVTDLKAVADPAGAQKVTLTWTNPTVNFIGEALTGLYSIRVYRESISDENLLTEIKEGVAVGGEMTWTDESSLEGNNTYVVVPCRIAGEKGLSAKVSVFTGFDVPGPVEGIVLNLVPEGIKITWQKPATTKNGGVLDEGTLKYTLVRMPDELTVVTDVSENEFIDSNPLPSWQKYSYEITPRTAAGEGEPSTGWVDIYAGPPFTAPFETTFDDYDANQQWASFNENNDNFNGYFDSYSGRFSISAVYYDEDAIKTLNTWIISPTINLTAGRYKVTVESYIDKADFANSFDIVYGTGQTVEQQTKQIGSFSYVSTIDAQVDSAMAVVDIPADGEYNFSVHMTADKILDDYDKCGLGIGYFKIEPVGDDPQRGEEVIVGDKTQASIWNVLSPVDAYTSSRNQMIYTRKMLGLRKGDIVKKISYLGYNINEAPVTGTLKGWIGSTGQNGFENNNISPIALDQLKPFFDGGYSIPVVGEKNEEGYVTAELCGKVFEFPLAEPYVYDGKNIVLAYESAVPSTDSDFGFLSVMEDIDATILQGVTLRSWAPGYAATGWNPILVLEVERAPVEKYNVTGTVISTKDERIEGAVVTVSYGNETFEAETDATGRFTMEVTGVQDVYDITIAKEGYTTSTDTFSYTGEDVDLGDVKLTSYSGIDNVVHDTNGNGEIKIYNLSGRLIKDIKISEGDELDLHLERGVYIINGVKKIVE